MSDNAEGQEELEKSLVLSTLSSVEFDEGVAGLHVSELMSNIDSTERKLKVCFALQKSLAYITDWE